MGLPQENDALLVGLVGRFVQQKGFDLIGKVIPEWLRTTRAQWALLGTGQPEYEDLFRTLARNFPDRVSVCNTFSNDLAHTIEAGADVFLMPSQYEPCGLNQLYSLRYGTVPIVRATGGLADTITDATDAALADGSANGFSFEPYDAQALTATLWRAQNLFQNKPAWQRLIETGMRQDWSWQRSAVEYQELYRRAL
jgi:starch synthase